MSLSNTKQRIKPFFKERRTVESLFILRKIYLDISDEDKSLMKSEGWLQQAILVVYIDMIKQSED